jgi:uncharacterized membrane protein
MTELTTPKYRVQSIDVLRGVIMIIMALDHVRDFFHKDAFTGDPLDPATTTIPLYFTRWITHFCAPIFVFLAGSSAYLVGLKKSKAQLSKYLITRGLWLMLIEVAIVTLGLSFDPLYHAFYLQVIWAIGVSMVILGVLVHLPYKVIFLIGCIIVLGHNLLDYPEAEHFARKEPLGVFWDIVHFGRFANFSIAPGHTVFIIYAFLPWTGVMLMGYGAGKLFESTVDPARRRKILLRTGLGLIALFIVLRFINEYGNPFPWAEQKTGLQTFFAFMNIQKYPPSLMYACATIGPGLIFLALIEKVRNGFTEFVKIYGRVPFFYYIIHFYLIHALTVLAFYLTGHTNSEIVDPNSPFLFRPQQFGYDLWFVYIVWFAVVIALFPLCRWYNRYKSANHHWWLSYV